MPCGDGIGNDVRIVPADINFMSAGKCIVHSEHTDTAMDGARYIWWNFVLSSEDQIKSAAEDWKNGRCKNVFGDEKEFIPLQDLPFPQ